MKRAVITGATGAIGTALTEELIKQNIEVLVICRKGSTRNDKIPKNSLVTVAYCDLQDLKDFVNDTGKEYDVFYHFAWEGTTGNERNDMYLQNRNITYTLDAVNLAKRLGCKTFIGAGSQAEYGRVEGVLKPDTPAFPEIGYGMAKLCAGLMSRELAFQLDMKHIWVRVLSVYGPNDTKNSMVMSTVLKMKENVTCRFTKGEQLWDYLYSSDAAKAFYLLGQTKQPLSKIYVLGSGNAKKLKEYIMDMKRIINPDCPVEFGAVEYAKKQVMHLQADITELEKDVGFRPIVSFEDGIKSILKSLN